MRALGGAVSPSASPLRMGPVGQGMGLQPMPPPFLPRPTLHTPAGRTLLDLRAQPLCPCPPPWHGPSPSGSWPGLSGAPPRPTLRALLSPPGGCQPPGLILNAQPSRAPLSDLPQTSTQCCLLSAACTPVINPETPFGPVRSPYTAPQAAPHTQM